MQILQDKQIETPNGSYLPANWAQNQGLPVGQELSDKLKQLGISISYITNNIVEESGLSKQRVRAIIKDRLIDCNVYNYYRASQKHNDPIELFYNFLKASGYLSNENKQDQTISANKLREFLDRNITEFEELGEFVRAEAYREVRNHFLTN